MKADLGISVVVCCYNSASRLPETLQHLAMQEVPEDIKWEVIVIDNASDDNTAAVAESEWKKHQLFSVNFKVLNEPIPGKSHALQLGVDTSIYEYILICDDDNWLNSNYIYEAYQTLQSDKTIGAAGGQGVAVTQVPAPDWLKDCQYAYAIGPQSSNSGDVSSRKYLWGAGMIFRKSIYLRTYAITPSLLTGRKKNLITSGEDVEFCLRILLLNYKLYYNDKMVYRHYMPKIRLTEKYRDKLLNGLENENFIVDRYSKLVTIAGLSKFQKASLFLLSSARFVAAMLALNDKWTKDYESQIIYFLTGLKFKNVPPEIIELKKIFDQLTASKNLQVENI